MTSRIAVFLLAVACACARQVVRPESRGAASPAAEAQRPATSLPTAAPTAPELRALARGALADRNLAVATAALEQYLRAVPHDAAAQFEAGWVAEQLGDVDGARHHYTAALESDPAHVPAALNLARSFRIGGQPQDAVAVCEAALRKTADDPRLLDALAASLRDEKKLDEAESIVRRVLERHPHEADAYKNLALIEADRGRVRLAEIALANARKLDANDPGIPNTLGILAMRRGEPAAARERFLEAVHLDERYAPAWANLGALALAYADAKAAHDAYAKAVALDPERYETHLGFAWALAALGKPAEARVEYESVLALRPAQEDAMFGRALSLKADNQLAAAKAVFEQLLSRGGPAHSTEARAQIASIDLRLRAAAGTATTAAAAPRPSQGSK